MEKHQWQTTRRLNEKETLLTITLPPELESALRKQAELQGTTPELLALHTLREQRLADAPPAPPSGEGTMADFFADYSGVLDSAPVPCKAST